MEIYRGDIFYIQNTGYNVGSEQTSGRPAIVVSNDIGNKNAPVVSVVYLTTQEKKPLPTHVDVLCKQKSTALCEQIYTVSKERIGDYVRTASDEEMRQGIHERDAHITQLEYELKKQLSDNNVDSDSLRLSVERDLYKSLYEQLLNKLTA